MREKVVLREGQPNQPFHLTAARLRILLNPKSLGRAAASDWRRYVADKADWLGARLAGTERPLAAISKHSGGASPECHPSVFFRGRTKARIRGGS